MSRRCGAWPSMAPEGELLVNNSRAWSSEQWAGLGGGHGPLTGCLADEEPGSTVARHGLFLRHVSGILAHPWPCNTTASATNDSHKLSELALPPSVSSNIWGYWQRQAWRRTEEGWGLYHRHDGSQRNSHGRRAGEGNGSGSGAQRGLTTIALGDSPGDESGQAGPSVGPSARGSPAPQDLEREQEEGWQMDGCAGRGSRRREYRARRRARGDGMENGEWGNGKWHDGMGKKFRWAPGAHSQLVQRRINCGRENSTQQQQQQQQQQQRQRQQQQQQQRQQQ
ncbi:hypothetical protein CC78DRAFT_616620 [Lojkania enalia]|uniref:Uncharacterized protein n=1 Tax=Lojkania enalia TaxID=147567 RepID=A0A9P4KEM3_9PLEO|nr:hypothetical protein CC78DRAFT_616620 [Didymosphaeria enalia]